MLPVVFPVPTAYPLRAMYQVSPYGAASAQLNEHSSNVWHLQLLLFERYVIYLGDGFVPYIGRPPVN